MEEKEKKVSVVRHPEPKKPAKKRPVHASAYEDEIIEHMKGLFPNRKERVFYEQSPEFLEIDVHVLEAPTKQDFHVLFTVGMSAMEMALPAELLPEFGVLKRSELMLLLPSEWNLTLSEEESAENRLWWPVNLMKYLARFPHEYKTWLGWGHAIPNSQKYAPYDESTKLCGAMLGALQEEISVLRAKNGTQINFYTVIPLYQDELDLKQEEGTESLVAKLAEIKGFGMIIFPDRPNVCVKAME